MAALVLSMEYSLISQGKRKHLDDFGRRWTCLSLKTPPLMQCPAGLEPGRGPVAAGADGKAFALGAAPAPRDGLRDRESRTDTGSDLPTQPVATRIHRRVLVVPAIPGVVAESWVCRLDLSLPRLGLLTAAEMQDGASCHSPWQGPAVPLCDCPLRLSQHLGRDQRTSKLQTLRTSSPKLLVEGDLSHKPAYFQNKSPLKAGKSQTESVRYPNVALS